jgi:butyryl-CoA dehydrogenase
MSRGEALTLLAESVADTNERARVAGPDVAELADALEEHFARLIEVTGLVWEPADPELALANASVYLEAAGHVVVAWLWLDQYLATLAHDTPFHQGKRQAARYFFRYELPRTPPQFDLLATLDRTTLDMQPDWF